MIKGKLQFAILDKRITNSPRKYLKNETNMK